MKFDRTGKRQRWEEARRAESSYNTRLRQVAKQVGSIIKGFAPNGVITDKAAMLAALREYSTMIGPWAKSVAAYMVADVSRRNVKTWKQVSTDMGQSLRSEILTAPTGQLFAETMANQVELIQSLPLHAAERVHEITTEALMSGRRAADISKELLELGPITERRARLIARTEVARTASNLTRARAQYAGSEGYIWRTSQDGDVRDTHRAMNGKYVRWDTPPKTDASLDPYHAGQGPNCRCYPEPVLPDL